MTGPGSSGNDETAIAGSHVQVVIMRSPANFQLGQVVATPGALQALADAMQEPTAVLVRHCLGDWGEVDAEDWEANNRAVIERDRLLSVYPLPNRETVCVITEGDRSITTILLPSEY